MPEEQGPHQHAEGEGIAQASGPGATAISNIVRYEHVRPYTVDPALLEEGRLLLENLPLHRVPDLAPPPPGSKGPPIDPNPLFVGREEDLKALAAQVKGGSSAGPVKTVCVSGIGGVGKTQLASEFVHCYGQFFRGGIYWLNLSNPSAAAEEIASCGGAGAMELRGGFDSLPLEDQVKAVKAAWLSELPRLIVLDNCEDANSLRACRPTTGGCRVVVTSRGVFRDPALAVAALELDVLDRAQSVDLLRIRCPDVQLEEAELEAVAEELGDLPLALDLAGRFLYEYRDLVSPPRYVEELRAVEPVDHLSLRRSEGYSPTDHELDVGRTFVVSYQRLDREDATDQLAIRLLARAARFAPGEPIERTLLLATLGNTNESEEQQPREVPDAYRRVDALRKLAGLGLVGESEVGLVRMHRLVASFARREVEDGEAQTDVVWAVANEAMDAARDNRPRKLTGLLPHLRQVTAALGDREDETAYHARFALGSALSRLKSYAEAVPLLESVVSFNTELLGATDWVTMRQRSDLGIAMNRSGNPDGALEVYEAVLEDQERELGPNDIDVASTLNNIGALLRDKGRFGEVLPMYQRALEIRKNALGWEHQDTAESLHNMGALMVDLGRYADAWPFLQGALEINEKVMGRDHLDNVGPLLKMGFLRRREGDNAEARRFYERVLEIREKALPPGHRDVGASLYDLGTLLAEQGDYEEAQTSLEHSLEISLGEYGEDHDTTAGILSTLADVMVAHGDLDAALSLHQRELAIAERIRGEGDPQTARCLANLAIVQVLQDRYSEARPLLDRAVGIFDNSFGDVHPATAALLDDIANVLVARGLFGEARPLYERSLNTRLQIFGQQHPETATSENNLANLLREVGLIAEALAHQERAVTSFQNTLGDKHSSTATSLHHLAALLRAQGRHDDARTYLVRALSAAEAVFSIEHPFTQRVQQDLSDLEST